MSELGEKLIAEVRRVAAVNPDYVYEEVSCAYVKDGKPSCLVGHALWNTGVIGPDSNLDAPISKGLYGKTRANYANFADLAPFLDLQLETCEITWLGDVQDAQDDGTPWDSSVRNADWRLEQVKRLENVK